MIVKVNINLGSRFPCLPIDKTNVNKDELLDSYSFNGTERKKHPLTVEYADSKSIITGIMSNMAPGDPLFRKETIDGVPVSVFIGIFAFGNNNNALFRPILSLAHSICNLTDICAENQIPATAEEPIHGPATTTSKPPIFSSPGKVSSDTPRKPEKPKEEETIDEEYEEFLRRTWEWNQPEEFDNDLYRSLDFKSGSTKKEIFFVFVLIILF
uniref:Peptidase S1 domain-containing protein n=1 Tax=Caenorhabditis tropicalis TaxID=1561998 RepID=A0A1I7TAF9_9PELO